MEKILQALKTTMEQPNIFGAWHLISLAIVVVLVVLVCIFLRNTKQKTYVAILMTIWALMLSLELINQFVSLYSIAEDGTIIWDYMWRKFPFQLCSLAIYILPFIALLKDGKVRDVLSTFYYTYLLFGGLLVVVVPVNSFDITIFHNVYGMAYHGLQVISAVYIAIYNRKRISFINFLYAFIMFVCSVTIATIMNVIAHAVNPDLQFNMFFISPYIRRPIPILNDAWQNMHWAPVLIIYTLGVSLIAFIIFLFFYLIFSAKKKKIEAF